MKIELFFTPACERCAASRAGLKAAAEEVAGSVEWREVDITVNVEDAVRAGVLAAPAMAIDDELVFPSWPTEKQLRAELRRRIGKGA